MLRNQRLINQIVEQTRCSIVSSQTFPNILNKAIHKLDLETKFSRYYQVANIIEQLSLQIITFSEVWEEECCVLYVPPD